LSPLHRDWAERLAAHEPEHPEPAAEASQAAVAAVLRDGQDFPEVLLMRRAERAGDRWSGQISLPGGKAEPTDRELTQTAIRETMEEVGLDISGGARRLCRLDTIQARARGGPVAMRVTPFVFRAENLGTPQLGPEASETFWLPLGALAAGELDHRHHYLDGHRTFYLPAWQFEGRVIWGLTHRMLSGLIDLISTGAGAADSSP